MMLDNTQSSMSTYTADCSGVASALYELGGMTVIHDASGCNSTYTTHDEPRWNTMPSAGFISALTEMDAVLGNDSRIIDDIVDAARKLTPAFVAIAGTPIPMMTGVDLKGIARLVESRTRIPSFAVQTNSMRAYSVGCAQAWIELSRRFVVPNGARAGSFGINLLGATPLGFSTGGMLESLRAAAARAGYTINACWAMGDKLESLANTAAARVNVVVSSSGLPLAQCFERCFGTPYVCGLPVGGLAPRGHAAVEWAAKNRRSVPAADFLGADAGGTRTAVLGAPLAAASTAAADDEHVGFIIRTGKIRQVVLQAAVRLEHFYQFLRSLFALVRTNSQHVELVFAIVRVVFFQNLILFLCSRSSRFHCSIFCTLCFYLLNGFQHFFCIHDAAPPYFSISRLLYISRRSGSESALFARLASEHLPSAISSTRSFKCLHSGSMYLPFNRLASIATCG